MISVRGKKPTKVQGDIHTVSHKVVNQLAEQSTEICYNLHWLLNTGTNQYVQHNQPYKKDIYEHKDNHINILCITCDSVLLEKLIVFHLAK
jgi:hypothetical protein